MLGALSGQELAVAPSGRCIMGSAMLCDVLISDRGPFAASICFVLASAPEAHRALCCARPHYGCQGLPASTAATAASAASANVCGGGADEPVPAAGGSNWWVSSCPEVREGRLLELAENTDDIVDGAVTGWPSGTEATCPGLSAVTCADATRLQWCDGDHAADEIG